MNALDDERGYDRALVTGVVLAGGRGSRMGGVDKGLVTHRGRPLVEWVLDGLRPQVGELIISANRNLARYRAYGHRVVTDTLPDFQGPLAGFAAALEVVHTPWLLTVPCDGPDLPTDLAARLIGAAIAHDAEIAFAHDGQRMHAIYALLRSDLLPRLLDFLGRGERKVRLWYAERKTVEVDFSDAAERFANFNSLDDTHRA